MLRGFVIPIQIPRSADIAMCSRWLQIAIQCLLATLISKKHKKKAIWNVRTLHQKGNLENISKEMDRIKLNILVLAVVRWKEAGSMKSRLVAKL
ncbi:endonuclease exonuclease phosphatase domain containing protein [Plakobranchus ocellatus]|uniref:Endonuclease exonuclease phosphatase domain containing protein n=1 Tax=Plakobranchus ocellatus TaxID=259542 RepID=A0AAV4BLD0_9GAST|nr:endonuclease exonuclease phosphatase domain containing protein [Plakobranchus ocellatus]